MELNEFTVKAGNPEGGIDAERSNYIYLDEDPVNYLDPGLITIEDYDGYGCEGRGHYLSTFLDPGLYRIVKLTCNHRAFCDQGHCGEMACWNYESKRHKVSS